MAAPKCSEWGFPRSSPAPQRPLAGTGSRPLAGTAEKQSPKEVHLLAGAVAAAMDSWHHPAVHRWRRSARPRSAPPMQRRPMYRRPVGREHRSPTTRPHSPDLLRAEVPARISAGERHSSDASSEKQDPAPAVAAGRGKACPRWQRRRRASFPHTEGFPAGRPQKGSFWQWPQRPSWPERRWLRFVGSVAA